MADFGKFSDYLQRGTGRILVLALAVLIVCLVGYYVVDKVRRWLRESGPTASDHVTNFRELHASGQLSDEEYRNIKSMLSARLQEQLKDRRPKKVVGSKTTELDDSQGNDLEAWPVDNDK